MITVVFGKPGVGKTAFMAANAVKYLNGSSSDYELYRSCANEVDSLVAQGFSYGQPEHCPVYSNFPIRAQSGYNRYTESYYIDGFHMGFQNEYVPVICVLPGSRIYLAEAQRYYNSRKSTDLPDWVSRYFEEHRHYGLDIMLDVQRPGLIDANIREITGEFIEVEGIEQERDKHGRIVSTTFSVKSFSDWKFVDKYLTTSEGSFERKTVIYPFNVFDCYESKSYYRNFLPAKTFDCMPHVALENVEQDAELAKMMYRQTAPDGFYPDKKRK